MIAAAILVVAAALVASLVAPLLTYGLSLATFGGAHVLTELRYVDGRFGSRLGARLRWGLALLLLGVVIIRGGKALHIWGGTPSIQVELVMVLALGLLVLPTLARAGAGRLLAGAAVVAAVSWGVVQAPVSTILALAVLHNWTPLGFLAEGLPPAQRRRGLLLAAVIFGLLPLAVVGLALAGAPSWPELTVLGTGSLSRNLGAYLPGAWHDRGWATAVFSGLVFAQCMHYAAVIGVLPRLRSHGSWVGLSRIPGRTFGLVVVGLAAVGLVGFALDFGEARSWYGLVAAVHAWVEVPVLLLALVPSGRG